MTAWGHLVLFHVVANIESLPASYADTSADIHHCLVWSLESENVFVLLLPWWQILLSLSRVSLLYCCALVSSWLIEKQLVSQQVISLLCCFLLMLFSNVFVAAVVLTN